MHTLFHSQAVTLGVAVLATVLGCAEPESTNTGASSGQHAGDGQHSDGEQDASGEQTDAEAGGQTGDDDVLPAEVSIPGATADCSCVYDAPMMLASVDEAPAGIAARDMLALVDLDGPVPIRWQSESEYGWEAPREIVSASGSLPDQISIEVTYQDGEIRFSGPTDCWRMDVEVAVSLRSEDGALDEQVTGWLHAAGSDGRGFANDSTVGLELMLHVPETSFRGTVSTAQDCMPIQGIAALGGTLDVETTLEQRAPTDPVDGPWTLSQRGRMVVIPVDLRFDQSGVHGSMDAWFYGVSDGSLSLGPNIAVVGAP